MPGGRIFRGGARKSLPTRPSHAPAGRQYSALFRRPSPLSVTFPLPPPPSLLPPALPQAFRPFHRFLRRVTVARLFRRFPSLLFPRLLPLPPYLFCRRSARPASAALRHLFCIALASDILPLPILFSAIRPRSPPPCAAPSAPRCGIFIAVSGPYRRPSTEIHHFPPSKSQFFRRLPLPGKIR